MSDNLYMLHYLSLRTVCPMKSNISERMYRMRNRHFGTLVALVIFIVLLAFVLQLILGNEELSRYLKTLLLIACIEVSI